VWTSKIKSLLSSLYKRVEFPLFGKEGWGRFWQRYVFSIMDSLVTASYPSAQDLDGRFWFPAAIQVFFRGRRKVGLTSDTYL
jgi:hypothetical protein